MAFPTNAFGVVVGVVVGRVMQIYFEYFLFLTTAQLHPRRYYGNPFMRGVVVGVVVGVVAGQQLRRCWPATTSLLASNYAGYRPLGAGGA